MPTLRAGSINFFLVLLWNIICLCVKHCMHNIINTLMSNNYVSCSMVHSTV